MRLRPTPIGARPKPGYVPITDWFRVDEAPARPGNFVRGGT